MTKIIFLLLSTLFWACSFENKSEQRVDSVPSAVQDSQSCQSNLNLSTLTTISTPYRRFNNKDKIKPYSTASGSFGIYYVNAAFDFRPGPDSYWFSYNLKPEPYGEWISLRKEFAQPFNARGCTGLELWVKIQKPSANARLRMTVCDVDRVGRDEMWWFDFDDALLQSTSAGVSVQIPFSELFQAGSYGSRENDGKLDLSNLIAYEISVFSPGMVEAKGALSFKEPQVY